MRYEELATQIGIAPRKTMVDSLKLPPVNSAKMQALSEAAGGIHKVEEYLKLNDAKVSA